MINDKITLKDLSVFSKEQDMSIFALLNHTTTQYGKDALRRHIQHPPDTYAQLCGMQDTIKFLSQNIETWPSIISNGTMVMLDKFFESADHATTPPSGINNMFGAFFQKILNKNEYFFTQFSISHISDFLKGCIALTEMSDNDNIPELLKNELETMRSELDHRLTQEVIAVDKQTPFKQLANLNFKVRREMKNPILRLMDHYARLDAWQSMARATVKHRWIFPRLQNESKVSFEVEALYHPLLAHPISYNVNFTDKQNFMLLTGANMSGKTTFMRALGVAALLAHLGAGVPAASMNIGFLQGIISNMQVEDDILRGESYFFAEVQRMKITAQKLQQPGSFLVLMDELFKGTNVHDAYECTRAVVEGLLGRTGHIMVLSTHLHEVAQHFRERQDIIFAHFVTEMADTGSYKFTYELKEGVSNDRIGYRILQKEGVLDLLKNRD